MNKKSVIHVRVDEKTKDQAEHIFHELGISPSQAINAFYKQTIMHQGLPFDLKVPNETTRQAMRELEQNEGHTAQHVHQIMKDIDETGS
jgi:DNA-damage-inducible protein J